MVFQAVADLNSEQHQRCFKHVVHSPLLQYTHLSCVQVLWLQFIRLVRTAWARKSPTKVD